MSSPHPCNVLMIYPRFGGGTFWNFAAACELFNAHYPTAPLGLITVAALLPTAWTIRLVDRNTEVLADGDLEWADLVMTGGMLPQYLIRSTSSNCAVRVESRLSSAARALPPLPTSTARQVFRCSARPRGLSISSSQRGRQARERDSSKPKSS